MQDMFETVKAVLAKQLRKNPEIITRESRIKADLGADSLSVLELLMTIEEDYGIMIPDEKLATFSTVGDVVEYLNAQSK